MVHIEKISNGYLYIDDVSLERIFIESPEAVVRHFLKKIGIAEGCIGEIVRNKYVCPQCRVGHYFEGEKCDLCGHQPKHDGDGIPKKELLDTLRRLQKLLFSNIWEFGLDCHDENKIDDYLKAVSDLIHFIGKYWRDSG